MGNYLGVMQCQIAKLADEDLAAIFKRLPPYERLIVSEVSRKWRDISKTPWRDVSYLDLSQVPTQHIHAVIRKCPNLTSVSALRQNLGDVGRFASQLSNISSLKCVECTFAVDRKATPEDASLRGASWEELIWHNSNTVIMDSAVPGHCYSLPLANPPTLRRLQMSALSIPSADDVGYDVYFSLDRLPLLESCIVSSVPTYGCAPVLFSRAVCSRLAKSTTNLRELYLDVPSAWALAHLTSSLPDLKILFLNNLGFDATSLRRLLIEHTSLCVVVITESCVSYCDGVVIPARKLFPNGFNAQPVPQLHLFLGKIVASKLRFQPFSTDALKIYPIDAPLPEFLEKEEIKPIFEGSWIASRIKEGAKEGVNLADYSFEGNAESISYVQS